MLNLGTEAHFLGVLTIVEQRAAKKVVSQRDTIVGAVTQYNNTKNKTNNNLRVLKMVSENKMAVKRIDFGGRVSGEVLTLLGFAVQQSFYEKFAELDIEHAIIGITDEKDKVVEIVEEYMNEPFFDGAYLPETKKKPFDIKAWGNISLDSLNYNLRYSNNKNF